MYNFDWGLFWKYIWPPTALQDPLIRTGLIVTLIVSVVAQALGVVLGLFVALGKMSKFAPFRLVANAYIWYFRGTPLLVQMMLLFFGLGVTHIYDFPDINFFGITINGAFQAAILALGVALPRQAEAQYVQNDVFSFQALDQNMWGGSGSPGVTYQTFLGASWDQSDAKRLARHHSAK